MQRVFGWWDWDAETPALVNRITGERLAFRGRCQDGDLVPSEGTWLRFDYLHPDLDFPLLVEESKAEEQERSDDNGKTLWRIDYLRSSALWRREAAGNEAYPSYGVWRRVDDCIADAFACWPATEAHQGAFTRAFLVSGGWLNGVWNETLRRGQRRCSVIREITPPERDYSSWLIPLDTPPPSPFVFHDHVPRRNGTENWEVENPVLPEGITFDNPQFRRSPHWPVEVPLSAISGRTAHLLSADGCRLLYPFYGDTEADRGRGHWSPSFRLLYVDPVSSVTCCAKPGKRSAEGAEWSLSLNDDFVFRGDGIEPDFYCAANGERPNPRPSRPLWLQTQWAVVDAWSAWQGSKAENPAWFPWMKLLSPKAFRLVFGYQGGVWGVSAEISFSTW